MMYMPEYMHMHNGKEGFYYGKCNYQPVKYVQGAGELSNVAEYAVKLGKKPFILISEGGRKRVGGTIEDSFKDTGCELVFEIFNGECSRKEIDRLVAIVKKKAATWFSVSAAERFLIPQRLLLTIQRIRLSSARPSRQRMLLVPH